MSAAGTLLVRTAGLVVGYGGIPVASGVDLEIRTGECWAVLGPNGSGKSTFLFTLLGLVPPIAGRVWLDPQAAPRARVGFVPQRCEVVTTVPTTVREFVSLGAVGTQATAAERRRRLTWALEHAGLAGLERHDFATLSGGQRQRAMVGRALVRRPTLLVLDEPTTHLDPDASERLTALLEHLHRIDRITIVMVSHDVSVALAIATHVALFRGGRVESGSRDMMASRIANGGGGA